jgi:hypothetical protein
MVRSRPFGVSLLAVLASIGAVVAGYHTLQYLHLLPLWFGPVRFFGFDLWGALLWGLTAIVFGWTAASLWNLELSGWLFVVLVSGWNVILAVLSLIGGSSISALTPTIVLNAAVLLYCAWPRTRAAFAR